MSLNTYGRAYVGSWFMGLDPSNIGSMAFGHGASVTGDDVNYLNEEFLRKEIVWVWSGITPRATVTLNTTEANGSAIFEIGIGYLSSVGSDLIIRELTAIGSKTNSFSADINMDIRIANK